MFHCLPYAGGVLQQPANIMRRLHKVAMARNDVHATNVERDSAKQRLEKRFK